MTALPPHDITAEQSVLGGMLLSEDALLTASDALDHEDFYRPVHGEIFSAILSLYEEGRPADPVLVYDEMTRTSPRHRAEGGEYLHTLVATVPTVANVAHYAEVVADKARLRSLLEASQRVSQLANGADADGSTTESVIDQARAVMTNATDERQHTTVHELAALDDTLRAALDSPDGHAGLIVPTGFEDLDGMLGGGLRGGQMITVAGRPGHGKSTLARDFARSCSIQHGGVSLLFSLEMSAMEIMQGIASAESGVELKKFRAGHLSNDEYNRYQAAMAQAREAKILVDDSASIGMQTIRVRARRIQRQIGLDLLIVDYMQLMSSGKRVESREREVADFSRQFKLMAKELGVPLIAVSQLNRMSEQRADKRPMLSDLRESGAIEQDSDIVMLLHRADAVDPESHRRGEADLILAKHRAGPTGTVVLAHQLHCSRFADMARSAPPVADYIDHTEVSGSF